ncbi:putative ABC transporter permease [Anaerosporobacter faecicola]|uniref:putative ABC transporter permease n=1 Tax=Anaerosporobacter faecicola TaxID=2718714 RepID=UPI001438A961|nr:hypothetical protein [Anaerosporobacter faecicola]
MVKIKNNFLKYILLFFVGGYAYCGIEILARGYSHISMLIAGGICFIAIGLLNEKTSTGMSFLSQMVVSSVIITTVEFITGVIVNLWMGLQVWDYSNQPYNVLGQVCLLYVFIWFFLSPLAILADDYLRYWLMGKEKPKYHFW